MFVSWTRIPEILGEVSNLKSVDDDVNDDIDNVENQMNTLQSTVFSHGTAITTLQETVNTLQTEPVFNQGITLDGGTSSYGTGVEMNNMTNTYITFKPSSAINDYAYLRQLGSENNIHIGFDFHDDNNDGRFSINSVKSANGDDVRTTYFDLYHQGAYFNVPVIPSKWISGQTMMRYIDTYNYGNHVVGGVKTNRLLKDYTMTAQTSMEIDFNVIVKSQTDRIMVYLSSTYETAGYEGDNLSLEIFEKSQTDVNYTSKFYSKQVWIDNPGGGTRSNCIFPCSFSYVMGDNEMNRMFRVVISNNMNDSLIIRNPLFVSVEQVKN